MKKRPGMSQFLKARWKIELERGADERIFNCRCQIKFEITIQLKQKME